ncbi:MAG: DUF1553 domain-containing protein [Planctomycetes bacterium]|nr:DUF1553 domain-containing protein [Planctomycetota bacterium]
MTTFSRFIALVMAICMLPGSAIAEDKVAPPVSERYKAAIEEVPNFQRHVIPLFGRLGCNGRACHGSFQGQGGFRLSLFGYDFAADHAAITGGETPRVNRKSPAESLIVLKPTLAEPHKGGKRLPADGWEYNLLMAWLKSGAVGAKEKDAAFASLDVEPKEIVFGKLGDTAKLRVIAKWADGTREDVTPLCRFRSNDESVSTVNAAGVVTAVGKGDTAVVAFYDNGIVPIAVLLPVSDKVGAKYPAVPTPTKLDELVVAKLRKLGIVSSDVCTDAEFLRRVSLDLAGTLPAADEVQAFLASEAPDKRTKKIEELLARPTYAAWWATKLSDFTGNSERTGPLGGEQALNREKAGQWYDWVYRRVRDNEPYDKLIAGIALGIGRRTDQSFADYCGEMISYFRKDKPADFAARDTMPYFWTRRTLGKTEEQALAFAHAFLGVNLQCAQCHKHPYDQWTKQDFDQFTAFFSGVRYGLGPRAETVAMKKGTPLEKLDEDSGDYKRKFVNLLASGTVLPFKELHIPASQKPRPGMKPGVKVGGRVLTPKLLGGEEVVNATYSDARQPVVDWMRDAENPYFARAFVNRVWANYFGTGLIDPPDDLNLANPPTNPALLDYLADGFVASKFDMKWLHRTITKSRTYQLSWRPNDTNRLDERNLSRSVLRRLPAEVVYDAVVLATASDDERKKLDADPVGLRSVGRSSGYAGTRQTDAYAVMLLGKPPRTTNCDCERSNEPALLQTVFLRNDPEVFKLLDRPEGWLKQVTKAKVTDADKLIQQAYLRTLSRLPDEREAGAAKKYISDAKDTQSGLRDLLWALINTKEFIVNR